MIAAQDLMIGDWVMYRGEPIIIFEIDEYYERVNTEPDGYDSIRCIELSDLQPIPLTADTLERNGFVKSYGVSDTPPYDKDEEGNMYYSFKGEHKFWGWWQPDNTYYIPANAMGDIVIKYLHELQHALRLAGIDKEIAI